MNNAKSRRLDDLFVMRKGDRLAVCALHTHDLGWECRLFSGDDLIATHVVEATQRLRRSPARGATGSKRRAGPNDRRHLRSQDHGADRRRRRRQERARQIDNARAFAASKGWKSPRPTSTPMTPSAARKHESSSTASDCSMLGAAPRRSKSLIMRDASRFSRRDGDEAFGELKRLAQAGVEIWFYQDGTRFTFGTFGDNVVGFVRAEMNAEYRRQIAKWTNEAMVRKAQAGHVTGGRVFGYDNVRVDGHVERRINETQADGRPAHLRALRGGHRLHAHRETVERRRAPAPRPQQGRPAGGALERQRSLHRPLYRGEVIWNKTQKRNAEGRTAPTARPEAEWLRLDRPELRIVSDEAWSRAGAARRDSVAARDGEGRSSRGAPARQRLEISALLARGGSTSA